MKILLIRLSSAGDIILVSSVVKFLKYNIPNCKINLLVKDGFEKAASLTGVDGILILKTHSSFIRDINSINETINKINNVKYDILIDLHSNFRSFLITFFTNIKIKSVVKKDILKRRLMIYFKWFYGQFKTIEEKYIEAALNALQKSGINQIKKIKQENIKKIKSIRNIVVHAGAKWELKRWPYFFDLVQRLSRLKKIKIFITGIKEEIEKNSDLLYIKGRNIVNLIGKTTFEKLDLTIKKCDFFIGNDTAAAHIAWLHKKPALIILGPTVSEFGFIHNKNFLIIEKKLACRPCNLHGGKKCPIASFECMTEITPDMVIEKIKKYKG